jgi:hypothetical protein
MELWGGRERKRGVRGSRRGKRYRRVGGGEGEKEIEFLEERRDGV